ncbi:hypothetical protein PVK06_005934 [Gossypium arboreum]|uniref:Uncharacterized protein n=1 Tax=Gossypium arboreum TaxID=29729 RepID=A0ABR0QVX9_GOSAR|nr:hypothetical protein PVK06_005934 [Gossypium arboreum]
MDTKFQEFKDKFRGDLQTLLGQYFGRPTIGVIGKGKGVMGGAPPGFAPKDFVTPNASQVLAEVEIGHYLDLFPPSTSVEGFQLAKQIEGIPSYSLKKTLVPLNVSARSFFSPFVASKNSSTHVRFVSTFQTSSVINSPISKPTSRSISHAVMAK